MTMMMRMITNQMITKAEDTTTIQVKKIMKINTKKENTVL